MLWRFQHDAIARLVISGKTALSQWVSGRSSIVPQFGILFFQFAFNALPLSLTPHWRDSVSELAELIAAHHCFWSLTRSLITGDGVPLLPLVTSATPIDMATASQMLAPDSIPINCACYVSVSLDPPHELSAMFRNNAIKRPKRTMGLSSRQSCCFHLIIQQWVFNEISACKNSPTTVKAQQHGSLGQQNLIEFRHRQSDSYPCPFQGAARSAKQLSLVSQDEELAGDHGQAAYDAESQFPPQKHTLMTIPHR